MRRAHLGSLVSLQSSYQWCNGKQKNSHKGLQFSEEPCTTNTVSSEQQGLWSFSVAVQQACVQSCSQLV